MRYRPKQTGTEPFRLRVDLGKLLLPADRIVVECHRKFIDDGKQNGFFKSRKTAACHPDCQNPVSPVSGKDTQVAVYAVGIMICKCARMMTILPRPEHCFALCLRQGFPSLTVLSRVIPALHRDPAAFLNPVIANLTVQKTRQLCAGNLYHLFTAAGFLKLIGCIQKHLCLIGILRRFPGDRLQSCGEGAGNQCGNDRHKIGDQIIGIINQQRKAGLNKQKIKQQNVQHCRNQTVQLM